MSEAPPGPYTDTDADDEPDNKFNDDYGLRATTLLPNLFRLYEKLCRRIATPDVHNLAYFLSTFFLAPVAIYIWEGRSSGGWVRRLSHGLAAWVLLGLSAVVFLAFGWIIAILMLAISRPLRRLLKLLGLTKVRPSPDIPEKLTFEFTTLDVLSIVFVGFIFLAMVANRDDLSRIDFVRDSDPAYHMAVARQIVDNGRIPRWDRWEYAPFGRPHLYPPLLHIAIAFFSGRSGEITFGFNTLQVLLYPLALLLAWYFARWLYGPATGFATLIFTSMGMAFWFSQVGVMPSAIVTALIPAILMAFLARKSKATIVLMTAALYTHGPVGVPEFVILGLLVFSMRYREYFPLFRKVIAFSMFLYLPWLIHVLQYLNWLGTSTGSMAPKGAVDFLAKGLIQLQIISPFLLILALRAWRRDKEERLSVVKSLLIGFLPMLFTYGGRYFMHTWSLWAILVARNFDAWLQRAVDRARTIASRSSLHGNRPAPDVPLDDLLHMLPTDHDLPTEPRLYGGPAPSPVKPSFFRGMFAEREAKKVPSTDSLLRKAFGTSRTGPLASALQVLRAAARRGGYAHTGPEAPDLQELREYRGSGVTQATSGDSVAPLESEGHKFLSKITAALPNGFLAYERLCSRVATEEVHNVPYFASTAFMAPIGIGIWNARRGGFLRRLFFGLAAWLVLGLGVLAFIYGGFGIALILLPLSRWLAADRNKPSLRRRVFALIVLSCIPLPIIVAGMPGAGGFAVWPGVTGTNAAMLVALHRSEPDRDFEELAEFIEEAIEPKRFPFSDKPPWPDGGSDPKTYNDYMKSEDYVNLKVRIVHIGAEAFTDKWGSKYFGDRIAAATGCRVDTGGWGPEVKSDLMRQEVQKSRREDPRCLFAYQKKDGFTDDEVRKLIARHRLDWTRRFGEQYLVGGRGLAGSLETF